MLLLLLATTGGCGGKTVVLGTAWPVPYHFHVPAPVTELASPSRTDNPTLTGDMLELYFTSNRDGGVGDGDVWVAKRATLADPFGTPALVDGVNTDSFETSSAISTDGLTLWFGSARPGGLGATDIWMTQRATRNDPWSTPLDLVGINSSAEDIPRPPGFHGTVMPMASGRASSTYQTYFATRPGSSASFGNPVPVPGIDASEGLIVDGFLTDDGLTLFYSAAPILEQSGREGDAGDAGWRDGGNPGWHGDAGGGHAGDAGARADAGAPPDAGPMLGTSDLFVAFRRSTTEPFGLIQPLTDLNTSANERDPWLSPDATMFYFTSDRDGVPNIYSVSVRPR